MHRELLIGGVFFGGACDGSIGKTQHYAPYDGALVGTAAEAGWGEVSAALDAAFSAFKTWRFSPRRERRALLLRIAELVRERSEELAGLLAVEVGKPISQARGEVTRLALTFDLAADLCTQEFGRLVPLDYDGRGDDFSCEVRREAIGVVLGIVPYNWPFNLAAHKIAPALAAGNTLVIKAPSTGTLSTLTLGRLIQEAGCPDGVVNVVNCAGALAQKAAEDDRVAMLSFTGSPKVGWMLKERLPRKRVALELGGDASAVVAGDADLDWAVSRLVPSAFAYAGQVCISTQHVLVHESMYEVFRGRFVTESEAVVTGDPLMDETVCGPVVSDEAADRILEWVSAAESAGATVLCGGSRTGRVIEPVVVEGVGRDTPLGCEEVFGPVVTLQPYGEIEEALDWVNSSRFGIHAAYFGSSAGEIERFVREAEVGGVIVGDSPMVRFDAMPYGGVKESGFGREGVVNTFLEMTEEKTLVRRISG